MVMTMMNKLFFFN